MDLTRDIDIRRCVINYRKEKYFYYDEREIPPMAVTYEDVFIPTRMSDVVSRSAIKDLSVRLARDVRINLPIVSANMTDVTGSRLAIALARLGGCGFIPQFDTIENRIAEVRKVKRAESNVIEAPITISKNRPVKEAQRLVSEHGISGLLVVENEKLVGILTKRDLRFYGDDGGGGLVKEYMTPMPLITAPPDVSPSKAREIFRKHKIEKLPLVDQEGRLCGLMTAKDLSKSKNASRDKAGRLIVGAAVGVSNPRISVEEAKMLYRAGADIILVDTARGFSCQTRDTIRGIREELPDAPIVAGNVDNAEGTLMLIQAGADCVKVGIGPGSACTTRMSTGSGTPQFTAVLESCAVAREFDIPVIADGGIEVDADLNLSLAAGASAVMLGGLLAGVEESPAKKIIEGKKTYKLLRGSASNESQIERIEKYNSLSYLRASEGTVRRVEYLGTLESVIGEMVFHLKSELSYSGTKSVDEFRKKAKIRWQSEAGCKEGRMKTH